MKLVLDHRIGGGGIYQAAQIDAGRLRVEYLRRSLKIKNAAAAETIQATVQQGIDEARAGSANPPR